MYTCIYNQYLLIEFVRLVDILQTEFELFLIPVWRILILHRPFPNSVQEILIHLIFRKYSLEMFVCLQLVHQCNGH